MSSFKEQINSWFKVFLFTVLFVVLILGGGDYAQAVLLTPNTAYRVDRTSAPNDSCSGQTAQVKFNFTGEQFTDGQFEEIYPIQDGWDLFFHTPNSPAGSYEFEDLNDCGLVVAPDSLELLSGFKTQQEALLSDEVVGNNSINRKREAHFVTGKDYYAYIDGTPANPAEGDYENYKKLGSLTAIGGTEYPALRGAAIGQLIIKANSIRAPHWHLKYNETGYCYGGTGQVGIIVPGNTIPIGGDGEGFYPEPRIEEFFVQPGEIFHFPEATQHYLRNVGDEDFSCVLFFAEGEAISDDKLLTITLANIVTNTPLGVLKSILVTDTDPSSAPGAAPMYTAQQLSQAPKQTYSSADQGPTLIQVVEACSGVAPDINNSGCVPPPTPKSARARQKGGKSGFSIYSTLKP